ncbi:hypothetical protein TNIN_294741 [Trichonephila inaurata madagascariensis]|uniref:SWIM-type domain-containing protein n=1 Tax=Trichonephila inaurata madagascariensis TaxID=2747483 RepID=A0A8X6IFY1_9ARAC|nr:hypothetical protein TNIN_294741 [Trichonephila inaurata madagascariensis]
MFLREGCPFFPGEKYEFLERQQRLEANKRLLAGYVFNLSKICDSFAFIQCAKFSSVTGNRSVAANVSKGLKLFNDIFVSKISFTEPACLENDDFFIQGFVKAEMKKRVTYKPSVQIRTTCQVISATCTCPAGGTRTFCKHVFALLHTINDYITKNFYEAPTERLQTCHQPKPVKMVPQTAEVFMRKPALEVENEIGFDFPPNLCYPCF